MNAIVEARCREIGQYIIDSGCTVRKAAKTFGVSKSTVHKDIVVRLPKLNPLVAKDAKAVLDSNKAERHIRGGIATHLKYKG
ncbi:sporulation transcriptional regulator SpoIIID [Rhodopseudomonas parapalustris]